MSMTFPVIYAILSVLLAALDFLVAYKSLQKTEEIGRYLGLSALCAGLVTLSYFLSVIAGSRQLMSVMSSLYFLLIDWMLVALARFVYRFTRTYLQHSARIIRIAADCIAAFDSAVMILNIFSGIALEYEPFAAAQSELLLYSYRMKPLYILHLVFTYALVGLVLGTLVLKCLRTPDKYRSQFSLIVLAILVVVGVNAVYLFMNDGSIFSQLDWSVFGYSIGLVLCYWAAFHYRQEHMLESLSMTIFQNIGEGLVLFDYMNELVMHNERAEQLLPGLRFEDRLRADDFRRQCGIVYEGPEDSYSVQCERQDRRSRPLQCDYSRLRDRDGSVIGQLYVLKDETEDIDLLTGFERVPTFRRSAAENPYAFSHPTAAVVMDIMGLGEVNRIFGREVGDQRIRHLARLLKNTMPAGTAFVRGHEAHLVAVCSGKSEQDILPCVEEIMRTTSGTVLYGIGQTRQDTVDSQSVFEAIEMASRALQIKQLLNSRALHSQTLTSLVRALQETDSDTEAHVRRTRKMGMELGRRIGLGDAELADLQLLCLLHDIGKIGIPLEILNKPGRLSEQEWTVLRTHTEKGYQIAMSSAELKSIAPMILYHHERWDGKGYPEKLAGDEIPVLSRVISIVDSYDAMVNTRSYRKALTPEAAQAEIRRCAGSQFDPTLAEEFLQLLSEKPDIAVGEKTGGDEVRVFIPTAVSPDVIGNTIAIPYSRYLLDLDEKIIEVDERFSAITGYSSGEVVGKLSQYDLIPPESRAHYMLQVNNAFSRSDVAYLKHELLCRDGSRIWVVCYGKRYYDSAEKAFRSEILIFRATGADGFEELREEAS